VEANSIAAVPGITVPAVGVRYGVKGADAAGWLARHGIAVPNAPNRVVHWQDNGGGRCLRLGSSEFLIEQDAAGSVPPATNATAESTWVLLRSDASLLLDGASWPRELAQACSFDFGRFRDEPDLVVMTLLAGISVTLVREPRQAESRIALRLWCDASYATYLQQCLRQLAA
jgi:sarcosine oxidase subunit gamma